MILAGAILGLLGSIPLAWFAPALVGSFAFGLVLLLGLVMLVSRSARSSLARASLPFALVGGYAATWVTGLSFFSSSAPWFGVMGVLGMYLAFIGSSIVRLPESGLDSVRLVLRPRLGAVLVLTGAALGLIGPGISFGPFGLLEQFCFLLVLLFATILFQERPESRFVAGATLYFALVTAAVDIVFLQVLWFPYMAGLSWLRFTGPIGSGVTISGAVLYLAQVRGNGRSQPSSPPGLVGSAARRLR
jgi:hypothetical protein